MGVLRFVNYLSPKKSRDGISHRNVCTPGNEGIDMFQPATLQAFANSCVVAASYPIQSIGLPITTVQTDLYSGPWNVQIQATGGSESITEGVNGLVATTSVTDNEGLQIRTSKAFTPTLGQRFNCSARFQIASLETRILFGFGVKNADPTINIGTAPTITDIICWRASTDPGDGVLSPSVRGNEGVIANGTALAAITIAQDIEIGITGIFGASGSAEFWYNLNPGVGDPTHRRVELTAAQLAQFQAIMTSAPTTMVGVFQMLNTAGTSRGSTIKSLNFFVERA